MLVDYTFFQGGILDIEGAVLNMHTPSETNKAIVDSLQGFVMQYESEYLGKLLGEKLYEEFSSYIANEGKTKEKRWDDLIARLVVRYSDGDSEVSKSPIANYIYFHYLRHNHAQAEHNAQRFSKCFHLFCAPFVFAKTLLTLLFFAFFRLLLCGNLYYNVKL